MVGEVARVVRFIIPEPFRMAGLTLFPWSAYELPQRVIDSTELQYEVLPGSRARVGTRLLNILTAVGLPWQSRNECCGSSGFERLLNEQVVPWILENRQHIAAAITEHSVCPGQRIPAEVLQSLVVLATILEERSSRKISRRRETPKGEEKSTDCVYLGNPTNRSFSISRCAGDTAYFSCDIHGAVLPFPRGRIARRIRERGELTCDGCEDFKIVTEATSGNYTH